MVSSKYAGTIEHCLDLDTQSINHVFPAFLTDCSGGSPFPIFGDHIFECFKCLCIIFMHVQQGSGHSCSDAVNVAALSVRPLSAKLDQFDLCSTSVITCACKTHQFTW